MKFKAAMFDFDGTVTELGKYSPSQELADALVKLAEKMPIAFCTGRQLESFERRAFRPLLDEIEPKKAHKFFENLYLIAENGSMGYFFNTDLDRFEPFYKAKWPNKFIKRAKLKEMLRDAVREYGEVHDDLHQVVMIVRTHLTGTPRIKETYELSAKIFKICTEILAKFDPDFGKYFHIGDSGIGVVICPAEADKDNGIKRFGEFLAKKHGIKFSENYREILVVGDRHQKGGNDYYFLNGRYGTPFTVGDSAVDGDFPKLVLDKNGKPLLHAEGTLYLIKSEVISD